MLTRRGTHAVARLRPLAIPLATIALTAGAVGCHHNDDPHKQKIEQTYLLKSQNTAQVVVGPPVAEVDDGVLRVSGTVHRQPGAAGVLDGRVDVDLIGPDGMMLDKSLHCNLQPSAVPMDASQAATYAPTPFGYVPPAGSTLRARYVDRATEILENLREGDLNYNGNGGHTGADIRPSQENGSSPANPSGGGNGAITGN